MTPSAARRALARARRWSGAKLLMVRTFRGLNQRQLAALSGVSCPFISQLETGRSVPTIDVAFRIADAMEVDILNFMTRAPASRVKRRGRSK